MIYSKISMGLIALLFASCGKVTEEGSSLSASGHYDIRHLDDNVVRAIKSACADPMGSRDTRLGVGECRLILAGASVRESSWNVNKSCEAWGNPSDPACGLTQSRRGDARAVGLSCDPRNNHKCNALTGLRNLRCKADGGKSCDRWASNRTLYAGIKKHLGSGNQGAFNSYLEDMRIVYNRADVRRRLGVNGNPRPWNRLLYAPQ